MKIAKNAQSVNQSMFYFMSVHIEVTLDPKISTNAKNTLQPRRNEDLKGAAIDLHLMATGSVPRVFVIVHRKLLSPEDCVSGGTLSGSGSSHQQ